MTAVNGIPMFTANDLRRLAEAVDGMRDKQLRIGIVDGALVATEADIGTARDQEIWVHTSSTGKPKPTVVTLTHPNGHPITVSTAKFDCVYWGEAACEKFLVPYYIRFSSDAHMQALRKAILHPEVIAMAHTYPTRTVGISTQDPVALTPRGETAPELYVFSDGNGLLDGWEPLSAWAERT